MEACLSTMFLGDGAKKCGIAFGKAWQEICHLDRSEAKWRDQQVTWHYCLVAQRRDQQVCLALLLSIETVVPAGDHWRYWKSCRFLRYGRNDKIVLR